MLKKAGGRSDIMENDSSDFHRGQAGDELCACGDDTIQQSFSSVTLRQGTLHLQSVDAAEITRIGSCPIEY